MSKVFYLWMVKLYHLLTFSQLIINLSLHKSLGEMNDFTQALNQNECAALPHSITLQYIHSATINGEDKSLQALLSDNSNNKQIAPVKSECYLLSKSRELMAEMLDWVALDFKSVRNSE